MKIAQASLASLLVVTLAWIVPARADTAECPIPPDLALTDLSLPAARDAVAAKHLVIMSTGGAASAGMAAKGTEFSYPERLAERLRKGLPGVGISVVSRAAMRQMAGTSLKHLDADLAQSGAKLVIWSAGGIEAAAGVDVDTLADELERGIAKIRAAGADVILMDSQYAPSIARVVNLEPYREVVRRVGAENDVPVLDRYGLMQQWSDDGVLDFDITDAEGRVQVARQLFDCLAKAMAEGILPAVRGGS